MLADQGRATAVAAARELLGEQLVSGRRAWRARDDAELGSDGVGCPGQGIATHMQSFADAQRTPALTLRHPTSVKRNAITG
jgi:hypothetical protein